MPLDLGQVEIAAHYRAHTRQEAGLTEVSNPNRTLRAGWLGPTFSNRKPSNEAADTWVQHSLPCIPRRDISSPS